jgi:hypothetical protein
MLREQYVDFSCWERSARLHLLKLSTVTLSGVGNAVMRDGEHVSQLLAPPLFVEQRLIEYRLAAICVAPAAAKMNLRPDVVGQVQNQTRAKA